MITANMQTCNASVISELFVLFVLTHRLSLADQKLVELLQQGRLPDDLPAHVGVPGLLVRIPGEDRHSE